MNIDLLGHAGDARMTAIFQCCDSDAEVGN
jgi:hypothetical protein